jgi:four helix bundle protein
MMVAGPIRGPGFSIDHWLILVTRIGRVNDYRDLEVWRVAMDLVEEVYVLTSQFPPAESFGLARQLQRAAVSIPSNIAEGNASLYRGDYVRRLSDSRASAAEVGTQIEIAVRRGYLEEGDARRVRDQLDQISRMTTVLVRRLRG